MSKRLVSIALAGLVVIAVLTAPCNAMIVSFANLDGPAAHAAPRNLSGHPAAQSAIQQVARTTVTVGKGATDVVVHPGSTQQFVGITGPADMKAHAPPHGQNSVDVLGKPVSNWEGRKLQQALQQFVNVTAPAGAVVDVKPSNGSGSLNVSSKSTINWGGRKLRQFNGAVSQGLENARAVAVLG